MRAAQHRRAGRRGERGNEPDGTVRRAQGIRGRRRRDRGDPEGRRRAAVAPRRASAPGGVEREVVQGKPVRSLTRHLLAAAAAAFLLVPPHVFPSSARPAVVSDIRAWTNQEYTRVVIDLEADAKYEANFLGPAPRATGDADGAAGAGVRPVVPGRGGKIVVMLDPGHGGKDPGATGPTGLQEKDVVLAIGRMVREKLSRFPEYDIRMTRETDVFIPLEERTAMANQAGRGIFVSLHLNASRNRRAEGISTYVLRRATDRQGP